MMAARRTERAAAGRAAAAIAVEDLLIWTYQRQRAHVVDGAGIGLHELERRAAGIAVYRRSADGCAAIAEGAALGARIDGGAPDAGALHPDAEAVHQAVSRLAARAVLIQFGLTGAAPDAMRGVVPRVEPVWRNAERRKPAMIHDANRHGLACLIRIVPDWSTIECARQAYRTWHDGLVALAARLGGGPLRQWSSVVVRAAPLGEV